MPLFSNLCCHAHFVVEDQELFLSRRELDATTLLNGEHDFIVPVMVRPYVGIKVRHERTVFPSGRTAYFGPFSTGMGQIARMPFGYTP